ncbi:hypothetical protein ACWGCW_00760 [Streptomyces sp. NPDC054933]
MKVIRTMPPEGWVPTANVTAQHRRLSWRAKGLLVDLLSFPDGYDVTFDKLMAMAKAAGDPDVEGRDAMRRAMQELERKGYIKHVRHRVADEKSGRKLWRTETVVCDLPGVIEDRGTGFQEAGVSVSRSSSMSEGQEVFNNTDLYKNGKQDGLAQSSSALAGARAGQHAREQDRRRELDQLYAAANELDNDRLRRLLLQFEKKRPQIYREQRQRALAQLQREDPQSLKGPASVRAVDLLSFKYALLHYHDSDNGVPDWLRRFPR